MDQLKTDVSVEGVSSSAALAFGEVLGELRRALECATGDASGDARSAELGVLRALDSVMRGERLCAELLAYSERAELVPAPVELLPLLCALAHTLRSTMGKGIDVSVDVAVDCPPCDVDAAALEAALLNLAINARDAMPHRGSLRFGAERDGAGRVAVVVEDTGRGMESHVASKAALPFFTTRDQPLAGMGLASVAGFARQSGGRFELTSRPRYGTTVRLILPASGDAQRRRT